MASYEARRNGVLSRTASILRNEKYSDVIFIVGRQKVVFPAHKLLLSIASSVFAHHFYQDGSSADSVTTVELHDKEPEAVSKLLTFVYTDDDLHFNDWVEAKAVLELATTYDIPELQFICQEYLEKHDIDPDKVCQMYETAMVMEMNDVMKLCQQTFRRSTKRVIKSSTFFSANLITLEAILDNDFLEVDNELELLEAIIEWASKECTRINIPSNTVNIRQAIFPLLKYIRFLTLSFEEFQNFLAVHGELLTVQEATQIMMKLLKPDFRNGELPPSLSNKTTKRKLIIDNNISPKEIEDTACKIVEDFARPNTKLNDLSSSSLLTRIEETKKKMITVSSNCDSTICYNKDSSAYSNQMNLLSFGESPSPISKTEGRYTYASFNTNTKASNSNELIHVHNSTTVPINKKPNVGQNELSFQNVLKKSEVANISIKEKKCKSVLLSSDEGSTSSSEDESNRKTEDVIDLDPLCRSCDIRLEAKEIYNDYQVVDMISNATLEVQAGKVRIIGLVLHLRQTSFNTKETVRFIVNVSKDREHIEDVIKQDISKPVHVRFSRSLRVETGGTVIIQVTVEGIELRKCFFCASPIIPLQGNDCRLKVLVTGNQKSTGIESCFAFAISKILFYEC